MSQSVSIGTGVILDSSGAGRAVLSAGNPTVISNTFTLHYAESCSVQMLTDGLSIVNYAVQVTNLPATFGRAVSQRILGTITARDDSAASNMWSNVTTGVIAKGTGPQGAIVTLGRVVHLFARVILTYDPGNTGTTSAYYVAIRNMGT